LLNNDPTKKDTLSFDEEKLKKALKTMLGHNITDLSYEFQQLHGGTVGDVKLISGLAKDEDKKEKPFKLVLKTQKKWDRFSDPHSWRREFDLYATGLDLAFDETFKWPTCYYKEMDDESFTLWLEYIDGVTGDDLTVDMYEKVAYQLGKFQGKLYSEGHEPLKAIENLSSVDFIKKNYYHFRAWPEIHDYIRSDQCKLPKHLTQMLINLDQQSEEIWENIEKLPVVFCHRDYWNTNIFYHDDAIKLIDWDTSGWGHLGEDMASLVADETKPEMMVACYKKCLPAYYEGFSENYDISNISNPYLYELILMTFGHRLVASFKFNEAQEEKDLARDTLEKIYEMGQVNFAFDFK
jgi:tRNA A-37 threonylcarbamoyl transferase component Bud32